MYQLIIEIREDDLETGIDAVLSAIENEKMKGVGSIDYDALINLLLIEKKIDDEKVRGIIFEAEKTGLIKRGSRVKIDDHKESSPLSITDKGHKRLEEIKNKK